MPVMFVATKSCRECASRRAAYGVAACTTASIGPLPCGARRRRDLIEPTTSVNGDARRSTPMHARPRARNVRINASPR